MGPNGLFYAGGGSAGPYGATPGTAGYGGGGYGHAPAADELNRGRDNLGGGGGGRHVCQLMVSLSLDICQQIMVEMVSLSLLDVGSS